MHMHMQPRVTQSRKPTMTDDGLFKQTNLYVEAATRKCFFEKVKSWTQIIIQ